MMTKKPFSLDNRSREDPNKSKPSKPAGYLFGKFGLLLLSGILFAAVYKGRLAIIVIVGVVLCASAFSKLWSRLSLAAVYLRRTLDSKRVFPGESVALRLELINRKLLPLPWVQVDHEMSPELKIKTQSPHHNEDGQRMLRHAASLLWYSKVSWKSQLNCTKRGYYRIGPAEIRSGDLFGFYPRCTRQESVDHIIVYPKIFPIDRINMPSIYPVGDTKARSRLIPDPTLPNGIREYQSRDSLKTIHWKASARCQTLQTKTFQASTKQNAALFLAVDSFRRQDIFFEEDLELGISAAASVACWLTERGSATGLFVNTCLADSGQPVQVPPGSSTGHLQTILEALAKVTPEASSPFHTFFMRMRTGLPMGSTLILIVSQISENLLGFMHAMKKDGLKQMILQVEQPMDGPAEGIASYRISHPGKIERILEGVHQ